MTDVIVSGHICADLIPEMGHTPASALASPGRLYEVGPLTLTVGGMVANTGMALHRLGVPVTMMAAVGDDKLGEAVITTLKAHDPLLASAIRVRAGVSSSYSVVLAPQATDRTFLHHTGQNQSFGADDVDYAVVKQARLFHLGYPPLLPRLIADDGAELIHLFKRVRQGGTVTSMDMAMPDPEGISGRVDWRRILAGTLPHVDLFLPSIDEVVFMLRRADYDRWGGDALAHINRDYLTALADELLALGAGVVGFKLGEMGVYLKTGDRPLGLNQAGVQPDAWAALDLWQPAFEVTVAGTTGAGDASYAGFMAALLRGLPPRECLRWACAVGACCVEAVDSTGGVRTWDETARRLTAGWSSLDITLS
jgi:sugar/nucleoside kinase (ribokinase family)